jgi:hypothetical protein
VHRTTDFFSLRFSTVDFARSESMEVAEARAKAAEYEAFIENRLKVDLKSVLDQREKLVRQIAD